VSRPRRWPELLETFISIAQREGLKSIAVREGKPINVVVRRAIDRELALSTPNYANGSNMKDKEIVR
jgi:hypothetical protein